MRKGAIYPQLGGALSTAQILAWLSVINAENESLSSRRGIKVSLSSTERSDGNAKYILNDRSGMDVYSAMTRLKEFDPDAVLDQAIEVFRAHGYEGTSARMLVDAMGIARQSLYDTFGDKWGLYRSALRRYAQNEVSAHLTALRTGPRAVDGLRAMLDRVIGDAHPGCLGVGSIVEFGTQPELAEINATADRALRAKLVTRIKEAQEEGDVTSEIDAQMLATFMIASLFGIRIAARGGADVGQLSGLVEMAMRAMR